MEKILVKYFGDVPKISKIQNGDWIDLRAAEVIKMYAGQFKMIPLGVAMQLPEGYEAIVAPRSSLFKNHGLLLVNSIGVIDESYCGNDDQWHFPALAMRDCEIQKGERICQFRIIKHQPEIEIIEVERLEREGRGGLGSTGRI